MNTLLKILVPYLFLIFLGLTTHSVRLKAQSIECGTPDLDVSQISLPQQNSPLPASSFLAPPPKIPVWIFHIRSSSGESPYNGGVDVEIPGDLNRYFEGVFEFNICGLTVIDNSNLWDLNTDPGGNYAYLYDTLIPSLNIPNSSSCLRIFLVHTVTAMSQSNWLGYAFPPITSSRPGFVLAVGSRNVVAAHEAGHFFSLLHTYQSATTQYVNSPNAHNEYCKDLGDNICDTPADPGDWLEKVDCSGANAGTVLDPDGVPYNPDIRNIMSDFGDCREVFSPNQIERMRNYYDVHSAYAPIRNAPAECKLPYFGKIERICTNNIYNSPIENVPVLQKSNNNISCLGETNGHGEYPTNCANLPLTFNRFIIPNKNWGSPLNGVSTYDMVLMSKHILGIDTFSNPFTMIAADVNYSGSITNFDIIPIRRLILGISDTLPAGSWRYVPKFWLNNPAFLNGLNDGNPFDAQVSHPNNTNLLLRYLNRPTPNDSSWTDHIRINPSSTWAESQNTWSFIGIKVGDVNCSAIVDESSLDEGGDIAFKTSGNTILSTDESKLAKIRVSSKEPISAWQVGFRYNSEVLKIDQILPSTENSYFDIENFNLIENTSEYSGALKCLWYSETGIATDLDGMDLFNISIIGKSNISNIGNEFFSDNLVLEGIFYDSLGHSIKDIELTMNLENNSQERTQPSPMHNDSNRLKIWPNPISSEFNIEFQHGQEEEVMLKIFDLSGKEVFEKYFISQSGDNLFKINLNSILASGMYRCTISAATKQLSGKIIVR